jgi:hypothetical protein
MVALPFTSCPRSLCHRNGTERMAIVGTGLASALVWGIHLSHFPGTHGGRMCHRGFDGAGGAE